MRSILKLFIFFLAAFASAPITTLAAGFVQVRNFTRNAYSGGPQNWAVTHDALGRLYIGNRDGMITCDGERWQKYPLPNETTVRSLLYDPSTDRIYCGGTEEFGYFATDPKSGLLSYVSLLKTLINPAKASFTEVWNILISDGIVWFQCDNIMLRFDGSSTRAVASPERISSSANINGQIYIGTDNGHISRLTPTGLAPEPEAQALAGKKIRAILPLDDQLLIATELSGLYLCKGNKAEPLNSDINEFLKDNQLFCAACNGRNYLFGTVTGGAVVKNFLAGTTNYINKESGMQNNTVLNAGFDKAGNIWLCLDNGLDYATYNSPITNLIGTSNNVGAGYTSLLAGNTIYFGTNQGLFSSAYPFRTAPTPIPLHRELQGQIWAITPISDNAFFVCCDAGAYAHDANGFHKIDGLTGTYCIRPLGGSTTQAMASCYDGFHSLQLINGKWVATKLPEDYPPVRGRFDIDSNNSLWISHWLKGIYRISLSTDNSRVDSVRFFTEKNGLPSPRNNSVAIYQGKPIVVNEAGFYSLEPSGQRFVPNPNLSAIFKGRDPLTLHINGNNMILIDKTGLELANPTNGTSKNIAMAKTISEGLVNGFEHVNLLENNHLLMANQNGFWDINLDAETDTLSCSQPIISYIYANGDSLVYRATAAGNDSKTALTLPFSLNSLHFDFACPDFRTSDGTHYSSYLEGYDNTWSIPSTESSREYTRLPEGKYTLHLLSRNLQTGAEGRTEFRFEITPPWYRSTAAKIIYIILIIGCITEGIFRIKNWKRNAEQRLKTQNDKKLDAMRKQAEKDALRKDYEIATLKSEQLEIDIKHKSDELSSATMNLIRKNEILHDIASKISRIQAEKSLDPGVQKQLSHIQTAIEQNISHDDDWSTFNRNFDVVYGDYTKRLHELHPQLSQADIRLCCYIKMGLTSKEIAPLINISFKSVEMARYRLRKKIGLSPDRSLTDYIASL
ncbi:MAG: hypothetical protein K2L05_04995 [Muribaculaceae bacterium]|nr:hypothetical protein [Muribaculaceae bacterium]